MFQAPPLHPPCPARAPDARSPSPARRRRARRSFPRPALATLVCAVALLACSSPEPVDYEARGVTVEIDRDHGAVTIDHEAIPGFMDAMTMTFAVAPELDLDSIALGERVEFTLRSQGQSLTVTAIRPAADTADTPATDHSAGASTPPGPADAPSDDARP